MGKIKNTDIYDPRDVMTIPFVEIFEISDFGIITSLGKIGKGLEQTVNKKCLNCGATKHKYICDYCGT